MYSSDYDSVTAVGNETRGDLNLAPDKMTTRNTAGERLIIDRLLDADPRPLLLSCWGGCNSLAQALYTIKTTRTQAEWDRAVAKARVYAIWYQDNGGHWIEENFPEIQIFEAFRWDLAWNYRVLIGPAPDSTKALMDTPSAPTASSDAAGFNTSVTVNGVSFAASPYTGTTTTLAGSDTMFATDSAPISGQLNRVLAGASTALGGADRQPFGSLSESYRSLLQTGFYNDGTVGGTVPATLSLSLGAPATFGAFVPGVENDYAAATTAKVISTAGDAALTVSESGHLTNGAFRLAEPLRTGSYSRTLTFTLSTTNP